MQIPELKVGPLNGAYVYHVEDVPGMSNLKFVRWGTSRIGKTKHPRLAIMRWQPKENRWRLQGHVRPFTGRRDTLWKVDFYQHRAQLQFAANTEAVAEQLLRALGPSYLSICES